MKSNFFILLVSAPNWDYFRNQVHLSEKKYITPKDKVHLNCNCNDGSFPNGTREAILLRFNCARIPRRKTVSQPRNRKFKKLIFF